MWVAGDFNLPDIEWDSSSTVLTSQQSNISNKLLDIVHDHCLTQIVNKPTRITQNTANILDLFLTNHPDMINRYDVVPGLSDHDIPLLDISTKIINNKKTPRRVYLYRKGNMDGLVSELSESCDAFCAKYSSPETRDVNTMWNELKGDILKAMDRHIPSKTITSSKHQAPWINNKIRREIKKRDRLYSKAKASNFSSDWDIL